MRVLIDILHPAHVHFFGHFRKELLMYGHEVFVTAREKDVTTELLDSLEVPFILLSNQKTGMVGLAIEMVTRTIRLRRVALRIRPDVMTGIMGPSITVAGLSLGIPSVVFYDTEFAHQTNWFAYRLARNVCTPDCYRSKVRGRHITYRGYHELAYLHPKRFTPDREVLNQFGLKTDERYVVVRFVSWESVHDSREVSLDLTKKRRIIDILRQRRRVLITSESVLPEEFEPYRIQGPLQKIHHLIAFADFMVGESATMTSEAAVLGVPAVFIAKTDRGYTEDQSRRYGLVHYFRDDEYDHAVTCIEKLIDSNTREIGREARARLLDEKIDVTQWMVDYFQREFS